MPAERMLPSTEAADLLALTRDLASAELAPIASEYEAASRFPRDKFRLLGKSGLLGLPYPEQWGGSALSYEVYLQVLEELATAWMTVAVGLSVHTMSCYPLAAFGTDEQRAALAARHAGRGPARRRTRCPSRRPARTRPRCRTRAVRDGDSYLVTGTKAWITHAGRGRLLHADGADQRRGRQPGDQLPAGRRGHPWPGRRARWSTRWG